MKDILQKNARVETAGGMHFYEQDIVLLGYLYTSDIKVDFEVEYNMPGFGLVIASYTKGMDVMQEANRVTIAKVGNLDFHVFKREFGRQEEFYTESNFLVPDGKTHKIRFVKEGTYLSAYEVSEEKETRLGMCDLQDEQDRYYIGIYSNKGNTVKDIDIYDSRPREWMTNIHNTNGGRIGFQQDYFTIENADKPIEALQENIAINPGRYFLSYDMEPVNGVCDLEVFLFKSGEKNIKPEEKSLLKQDKEEYGESWYFDIDEACDITVLVRGMSGKIGRLAIKEDPLQDYVSTGELTEERTGSFLQVNLGNIQKVEWDGYVEDIPRNKLEEKIQHSIMTYGTTMVGLNETGIDLEKKYSFVLEKRGGTWIFTINDGDEQVYYKAFAEGEKEVRIFDNISGYIDKIITTDDKGEERNVLYQRTIRKYIPTEITSPIIITDKDDVPFDLSSAYRRLPDGRYYFTNWEREIFEPARSLSLAKKLNGSTDVIVYGVEQEFDWDKIYDVEDIDHVNSIDLFLKKYDQISSDLFSIKKDQYITLDDEVLEKKYKYYIIDYMKNDSYAINITVDGGMYEVDIATENENINTYYDMAQDGQVRMYKKLDAVDPQGDQYIVLRKNEAA